MQLENNVENIDNLCAGFKNHGSKIGILGLGYVGLPLACAACDKGFTTFGFDIDKRKINKLNKGESYIGNIHNKRISTFVENKKFVPTGEFKFLADMDAIIMCVPTPLDKNREPDVSYIINTVETVAKYLQAGQLIVLESTTYPGTTDDIIRPILEEATGLKSGEDFYLAFSPEREDPGNPKYHTANIPKVLGGDGKNALRLAKAMYGEFLTSTVTVSSSKTAEAVKLTENIFRSVNIALVNELKVIYDKMGIDIWEVIDAAATKPFGYMPFYPGPGLGGHCIPIDPFYLTWKAKEFDINTRFIELAGEINISMPAYVVGKLAEALDLRFAKSLNGAKILIIGMAYKKNVADDRESPSYAVMKILHDRKVNISYHDPYIDVIPPKRDFGEFSGMKSVSLNPEMLKGFNAVLIITDHSNIDYKMIAKNTSLVIDTRNALAEISNRDNIIKA